MNHKPSPSRLSIIASIAAAVGGLDPAIFSPAQILHRQRGKAPTGMRFKSSSIYWPAGPLCNVEPTRIRNQKVCVNVHAMHEKWLAEQFPSHVAKKEPDPTSISQIKLQHRCHRSVARQIKERKAT